MSPPIELGPVTVRHDDCLDVLRAMPAESVDAVVTDPPYGIAYESHARTRSSNTVANDGAPFVWWLADAYRVLRDRTPLVCFCRWDVAEAWRMAITWAGFRVRAQIVWNKRTGGQGDTRSTPSPTHEIAWLATKGAYALPGGRPLSVATHARDPRGEYRHPTQKPVPLMLELLRAYVAPGGLVLDPFAGSGSTLVAAAIGGFRALGVELDSGHVATIEDRVRLALAGEASTVRSARRRATRPPAPSRAPLRRRKEGEATRATTSPKTRRRRPHEAP